MKKQEAERKAAEFASVARLATDEQKRKFYSRLAQVVRKKASEKGRGKASQRQD
jgi:hypothetical protein